MRASGNSLIWGRISAVSDSAQGYKVGLTPHSGVEMQVRRQMRVFRQFEEEIIRKLASPVLGEGLVEDVLADGEFVSLDYTGVGYFLTVRHPGLPIKRVPPSGLGAVAEAGGISGIYLVLLDASELTLECASTESVFPADFRDQDVRVVAV